jgi:IPT/TIG domain.
LLRFFLISKDEKERFLFFSLESLYHQGERTKMPYQFRCPLCLKRLGPSHTLIAFHDVDPTAEEPPRDLTVDCGEQDFISEIIRFGERAIYTPVTDNAVFVSHLQCDAFNPFWEEEKTEPDDDGLDKKIPAQVKIPGDHRDGEMIVESLRCEKTGVILQKTMHHRIISMLRSTRKYDESYRPMWFPFALLRSTAAAEGEEMRRPFGSLVEMASAPGVGKTILTLQLMNKRLYTNNDDQFIEITDYFFPRRESETQATFMEAFLKELFYHSTWIERPEFRPLATFNVTPGDLRAVFIRPVRAARDVQAKLSAQPSENNKGILRKVIEFFSYAKDEISGIEEKETPKVDVQRELSKPDYWYSVLFYDTAGETQVKVSNVARAVRRLTNKLAICIDAQEIFDTNSDNKSISHACKRISTMIQDQEHKSSCLIVTKLDLLPFWKEQKENFLKLAEDLQTPEMETRRMLINWLVEHRDHDKDELRQYLLSSDSPIEKVFFVWTENLPKMLGIRSYPIKSFEPQQGEVGTEVTITASDGYDFKEVEKLSFNGTKAEIEIESSTKIKTKVPVGATTGFIEIELKDGKDKGTSEQYFTIGTQGRRKFTLPRSYGLIKFLAWCLDKSPRELVKELKMSSVETHETDEKIEK